MKRLVVAVAIALSTTPALAAFGAPYEEVEIDRLVSVFPEYNRGSLGEPERVLLAQMGGGSYTSAMESNEEGKSPWADDHNFIAPPQ